MGHAVGRVLGEHGLDVITCLQGRSERTRYLSDKANIRDVLTLKEMVAQADLIMSILVPAEAIAVATLVAEAIKANGGDTLFADCNAVSPNSARVMDDIVTKAGGRFIDASIIGGPPGPETTPRIYVSGPFAGIMTELDGNGIAVPAIGDGIGRASAIKMCYAAGTKGTAALHTALLTAAEALGVLHELTAELKSSQPDVYRRMEAQVPGLPIPAHRWIGEMEEISATFDHVGVTPDLHRGAADVFRLLSETPFAMETPETMDPDRTLEQTISALAKLLPPAV
jgi:3-hydroxyisobutyrate dehydrogenase-like beta-hydroxyacid dehydrogenase